MPKTLAALSHRLENAGRFTKIATKLNTKRFPVDWPLALWWKPRGVWVEEVPLGTGSGPLHCTLFRLNSLVQPQVGNTGETYPGTTDMYTYYSRYMVARMKYAIRAELVTGAYGAGSKPVLFVCFGDAIAGTGPSDWDIGFLRGSTVGAVQGVRDVTPAVLRERIKEGASNFKGGVRPRLKTMNVGSLTGGYPSRDTVIKGSMLMPEFVRQNTTVGLAPSGPMFTNNSALMNASPTAPAYMAVFVWDMGLTGQLANQANWPAYRLYVTLEPDVVLFQQDDGNRPSEAPPV